MQEPLNASQDHSRLSSGSDAPSPVTFPRCPDTEYSRPITLAIDIGGSGVKAILLDGRGRPVYKRRRLRTPRPATPTRVIDVIRALVGPWKLFDRVAVGFPGYVEDGVVRSAPNLHPNWISFDLQKELEELTGRAVRVINDAEVHGLGHITGEGLELVITFGTGVGSAVFVDGKLVPGLEIGQQYAANGKTYEVLLNRAALAKIGKAHWRKRVCRMVQEIDPVWNYHKLYLGGGNARYLKPKQLPGNVVVVSNVGGLWGGLVLWDSPRALDWSSGADSARENVSDIGPNPADTRLRPV